MKGNVDLWPTCDSPEQKLACFFTLSGTLLRVGNVGARWRSSGGYLGCSRRPGRLCGPSWRIGRARCLFIFRKRCLAGFRQLRTVGNHTLVTGRWIPDYSTAKPSCVGRTRGANIRTANRRRGHSERGRQRGDHHAKISKSHHLNSDNFDQNDPPHCFTKLRLHGLPSMRLPVALVRSN